MSITEELNISEILKGKSKGTKLYSPIFGECIFSFIQGVTDAICVTINEAHIYRGYDCILQPKYAGNPPSSKESHRTRRMFELRKRKGRL